MAQQGGELVAGNAHGRAVGFGDAELGGVDRVEVTDVGKELVDAGGRVGEPAMRVWLPSIIDGVHV